MKRILMRMFGHPHGVLGRLGKPTTPTICWFEIPADDPQRAKKFYGSLFG